jgi:FixJ family two-component response regulator
MKPETFVLVVDDDKAARDSLQWLLESVGHKVICYASASDFLSSYSGTPGCLVLDVRMPGMSGLELQREVDRKGWCLPIILVTGHGDVPMAVRAMQGGAIDFLQKPYNDQVLLERTEQALAVAKERWDAKQVEQEILSRYDRLTRREREIASLVSGGKSNKNIAALLGLSCKTVEVYRSNVMAKMAANSVVELVRMLTIIDRAGRFEAIDCGEHN